MNLNILTSTRIFELHDPQFHFDPFIILGQKYKTLRGSSYHAYKRSYIYIVWGMTSHRCNKTHHAKDVLSSYKTIDDAKFLSKQKGTYIKRNANERIVYLWLYFTMCDTYLLFWSTLMAGLKENRLLCPLRSFWFLSTYRLTIMCKLRKINLWKLWKC